MTTTSTTYSVLLPTVTNTDIDRYTRTYAAANLFIAQNHGFIIRSQPHTGRGKFGFFGPGKFLRAARVIAYCKRHSLPYWLDTHEWNEVAITI